MLKQSVSAMYPCYNDEGNVEIMAKRFMEILPKIAKDYEIVIVDDCSPDKSGEIADKLAKKYKFIKVVHHKKNRGYGGAIISGFNNCSKELIFYTDGDLQYNPRDIVKLVPFIGKYDLVNGYKIKRGDGFVRAFVGGSYNFIFKLIFGIRKIKDTDCDFRLFNRKIIDTLKFKTMEGSFPLEFVKRVEKAKFKIKNIPVPHYPRYSGSSQFFRIRRVMKTLRDIFKLWVELILKG